MRAGDYYVEVTPGHFALLAAYAGLKLQHPNMKESDLGERVQKLMESAKGLVEKQYFNRQKPFSSEERKELVDRLKKIKEANPGLANNVNDEDLEKVGAKLGDELYGPPCPEELCGTGSYDAEDDPALLEKAKQALNVLAEAVTGAIGAIGNFFGSNALSKDEYHSLPAENRKEIDDTLRALKENREAGFLEGNLKPVAVKVDYYLNQYHDYEESNPIKAKAALFTATMLAKGLVGAAVAGAATAGAGAVPGFIGGIIKGGADEVKGVAFSILTGDALGELIGKGIREYSPMLIKLDSTLTPQEAAILGSIAAATVLSSGEFRSFAKSMKGVDFSDIKIKDGKLDGTFYYKKDIPDTVDKIGGRYPRNAEWAGKVYLPDDLPDNIKVTYPDIKVKYPNGVKYDAQGFPDFSPYAIKTVKLEKFTPGNYRADYKQAAAEVRKTDPNFIKPDGYTWHHHQDGTKMELIPEDLHDAFKHTGGMSTTKHGVKIS
jgi:hypothetical protein